MTFISYAQNFEDVMLWRALRHVSDGFYVDVGAADPDDGSVTRAFYERGWRGINIEPEPNYAAALRARRPRDVNLAVLAGANIGRATLQRFAGTGLSTCNAAIAAEYVKAGYPNPETMEIEVTTISQIAQAHAPNDVHFLKIDVEGAERDVLLGADLQHFRPWIIVIEATKPFSPERTTHLFEDLIIGADYRFRWFDGLNAYYICAEHDDRLRTAFQVPPNFSDHFVMGNYLMQANRADAAERQLAEAQADRQHATERIKQLTEQLTALEARALGAETAYLEIQAQLAQVFSSTSWRLTAPLRHVARVIRGR